VAYLDRLSGPEWSSQCFRHELNDHVLGHAFSPDDHLQPSQAGDISREQIKLFNIRSERLSFPPLALDWILDAQ
jgi:hypothetical protein